MKDLTLRLICKNFGQRQRKLCKDPTVMFYFFTLNFMLLFRYECFSNISSQIQDPLVLLDPVCLREALQEWLPVLERVLGPDATDSNLGGSGEDRWERDYPNPCAEQQGESTENIPEEKASPENSEHQPTSDCAVNVTSCRSCPEPIRVVSPEPVPSDLSADLTKLATLYTELSCFSNQNEVLGCSVFLRRYFFLLDQERVRRMCLLCYQEQPEMKSSFTDAMLGQKLLSGTC